MARPKSYIVEEVVERVVYAFWQHGYQALGLRELERLTGLNQFAIRTEFGGKEGLYLAALEFYTQSAVTTAMQPMRDGGVPEITGFLKSLVTDGSMTSSKYGCLVVNTGIENARVGSVRLEEAVRHYWDELESCFLACLQKALSEGKLDPSMDVPSVAKGLVSGVMGVHAQNRLDQSNRAGRFLVDVLCNQLKAMEKS
ncbi:TetR/AcrR family transcriptional regulator [Roseibium sp. HPY-6]|uniref:TetR/AcrR family transcriptional regulator n=1 Tax=Roseibium sp. HPY-6 TaxID=3229852 RepID=UPI00338F854A